MIFRPQNFAKSPTPLPTPGQGINDNILELNLTQETLAFSSSLGSVPNRGMVQADMFLNGVPYVQTVSDVTNGKPVGIHFEPGLWLAIPATTNPSEPASFARMASIPHGTTINLQGSASVKTPGAPVIPAFDPTPWLQATRAPIRFSSQTAANQHTFRIPQDLAPFMAAGTITQAILDDPNTVLRNALAGQTIIETLTLDVASAPAIPVGALHVPAEGGGNANIAFLAGGAGGPNADIPKFQPAPANRTFAGARSTFWIETVEHVIHLPVFQGGTQPLMVEAEAHPNLRQAGPKFSLLPPFPIPRPVSIKVHSTQIQYSQVVLLNFNGLTWPHVSVATLTPTTPIVPSPAVWAALKATL